MQTLYPITGKRPYDIFGFGFKALFTFGILGSWAQSGILPVISDRTAITKRMFRCTTREAF